MKLGIRARFSRHDDQKLFATDPADNVAGVPEIGGDPRELHQNPITEFMAVVIVDAFEVIDVEDRQCDWRMRVTGDPRL